MCKVKGDEYMRIHRAISNISPLAFWENIDVPTFTMKIDFMEILPEEFRADCDELAAITVKIHQERLDSYWKIVKELPAFNLEEKDGKKNRYQHVVKHYPNDYGPVMGLLNSNNDRSVREIIHRAVRPTGNRYEGIEVSQSLSRFLKVMDEV